MKKIVNYRLVFYFAMVFPIVYSVFNFSILKTNTSLYKYIPQSAKQVIEVNSKNLINKVVFQYFYNEHYNEGIKAVKSKVTNSSIDKNTDIGVDFISNVILFSEEWGSHHVWYLVVKVINDESFKRFIESQKLIKEYALVNGIAVCQLTVTEQQTEVKAHLIKIANLKVKSFDAKIDLSTYFNTENDVNSYVSSSTGQYFIDGFSSVNFKDTSIELKGEHITIGSVVELNTLNTSVMKNIPFAFSTTLNLFDDSKKEIEDCYFNVNYYGTNLVISNNEVPIHIYPQVKLFASNVNYWEKWFDKGNQFEGLKIDSLENRIDFTKEVTFSVNYKLHKEYFTLFSDSTVANDYGLKSTSNAVLSLHVNPELFIENINYIDNELNPPSMVSQLKVNVMKNVIDEIVMVNKVKNINLSIKYSDDKAKLLSEGAIVFKEKKGHSIIEALLMIVDLMSSIEMIEGLE